MVVIPLASKSHRCVDLVYFHTAQHKHVAELQKSLFTELLGILLAELVETCNIIITISEKQITNLTRLQIKGKVG
jgi:hypothetical protein